MGDKLYPPQPWLHEATCVDAPRGLPIIKAQDVPTTYPYGRPHTCVDRDTGTFNRDCVAEFVDYETHPYVYSTIWPADATGPLCSTCRGSHPESAIEARTRRRVNQ
jgi:hypothetical protein